uniref:Uncharacterized protein n=1 Tax=Setaria italica TaxID=4555 RepID=K3Y0R9_SETIT
MIWHPAIFTVYIMALCHVPIRQKDTLRCLRSVQRSHTRQTNGLKLTSLKNGLRSAKENVSA